MTPSAARESGGRRPLGQVLKDLGVLREGHWLNQCPCWKQPAQTPWAWATRKAAAREALEREGAVERVCRTQSLRQLGRAVDVARTVAFLCSDASRHLSGQVITVAGGMEGRMLWDAADIDEDAVRHRVRTGA